MSDDIADLVLIFLQEFACRGECNLVYVFVDFLLGHTDTAVNDSENLLVFIKFNLHEQVAQNALEVTGRCQCLYLFRSIDSICHEFPQENLMVRIQELLDHREDIFRSDAYFTFYLCHNI